jgi:hypothetical protein
MNKNNRIQVIIPKDIREDFNELVVKSKRTESTYVIELIRKDIAGCQHVWGTCYIGHSDYGPTDPVCIKCGAKPNVNPYES